jgi:hypothetical protein
VRASAEGPEACEELLVALAQGCESAGTISAASTAPQLGVCA